MQNDYILKIISDPFTNDKDYTKRKIFGELLATRLEGYVHSHGNTVSPVDKYDYISTHFLLYRKEEKSLKPVATMRLLSNTKCDKNTFEFLPLTLMKTVDNNEALKKIDTLIKKRDKNNQDTYYISHFTVNPDVYEYGDYLKVVKLILGTTFTWLQATGNNEFYLVGTTKTKTDQLHKRFGLKPITEENFICKLPLVNNEDSVMMEYLDTPTRQIKILDEDNDVCKTWEEREDYSQSSLKSLNKTEAL